MYTKWERIRNIALTVITVFLMVATIALYIFGGYEMCHSKPRIDNMQRTRIIINDGKDTIMMDKYGVMLDHVHSQTDADFDTVNNFVDLYVISKKDTVHDTINSSQAVSNLVKPLLLNYYKAGWIDASNKLIDLYNKKEFESSNVYRLRAKDWQSMELKIEQKSQK